MSINCTRCSVQYFSEKLYSMKFLQSIKYFLSNRRTCTSIGYVNSPSFDYHEMKSYKEYLDERKVSLEKITDILVNSLNFKKDHALNIVTKWEPFRRMTKAQIVDNIHLLREEAVNEEMLKRHVCILTESTHVIKQKIDIFKGRNIEINSALPLFQLSLSIIQLYERRSILDKIIIPHHQNRMHYLTSQLETDVSYLCTKIVTHPFLLHVKMQKIVDVTNFLIEIGVKKHYIVEDLMVYKYAIERIKQRMFRAKKANMKPLKPWVVRCLLNHVLSVEIRRQEEEEFFQSCKNIKEYLSRVLNADIELIEGLLRRNPGIYSIKLKKLTDVATTLRNVGYTGTEVFYVPRVFFCGSHSLEKKIQMWKDHGLDKPPLFALTLPMTSFKEKLERELKNRSLAKD